MLYRKKGGALVGNGERVRNPYGEGELIVTNVRRVPVKDKRGKVKSYETEVETFASNYHGQAQGYESYEPYELGLVWKD